MSHGNWLPVAKSWGNAHLEGVHTFPKHQQDNPWRNLPETLRPGQLNLTSSLKMRQVVALLRSKSNNEAICPRASKLWSSGTYWWVCRNLWVGEKQVHLLYILSNGILICQKLEEATDQRGLKTSWKCIFVYHTDCWVPERPNICRQWNLCGELGIAGAHGAVQPDLCMPTMEEVYLHVFAKSGHCFEQCQVKWWFQWELCTIPLRNQPAQSGSDGCSRNRQKEQWGVETSEGKNKQRDFPFAKISVL